MKIKTHLRQFTYPYDPMVTAYKFNGKEKDEETGMYYYGARYYIPELSIWGSVDPMADKYPHMTPYNYCSNNPMKFIDPDGMDNIIFLVDLQKENKKVDTKKLINETNKLFESLGLETRMELAPDGKNFNPDKMDKTDSYVALGSSNDVKDFVKNHESEDNYNMFFKGWEGGAFNPESAVNVMGKKSRAIGMDANGLVGTSKEFGVETAFMGAFLSLHGAGHNANLNHSDDDFMKLRSGQNALNCALMFSGNRVREKGLPFVTNKKNNSNYINVVNQYFGGRKAQNNYKP